MHLKQEEDKSTVDWDDIIFEVDLLKSQEINLDYILGLIFEHNKQNKSKATLIEEVRRLIRSSLGNRAKESLIVNFIEQTNLDEQSDKAGLLTHSSPLLNGNSSGKWKHLFAAKT